MLLALALLASVAPSMAQEIPPGVRYKKAPQAVNDRATAVLKKLFSADPVDADFTKLGAEVIVCGPGLWNAIKRAVSSQVKASKPVTFIVDGKKHEGRGFQTAEAKEAFWIAVSVIGKAPSKPVIRRALKSELEYFWAVIAWDIEEPVLVADFGKRKLIFDFEVDKKSGQTRVFYVDVIGTYTVKPG